MAQNTANTLVAVVKNRLSSMINDSLLTGKVNAFIEKIITKIPDQIDLGQTGLYLDGWLYEDIQTKPERVTFPLKAALKYDGAEWPNQCTVNMPSYTIFQGDRYSVQFFLNGCLINEALWSVFETGLIDVMVLKDSSLLTTTALIPVYGFKLSRDFGGNQHCSIEIALNSTAPEITLQESSFLLTAVADTDLKCRHKPDNEFEQVSTFRSTITAEFTTSLAYQLTFKLEILNINFSTDEVLYSDYNPNTGVLDSLVNTALAGAVEAVNVEFSKGKSFGNIFDDTILCWLNLNDTYLKPNYQEGYMAG